ncbi:hypothetical protein [Salinispira pacifica]
MTEPLITKSVAKENAYYTVTWSSLRRADKFEILKAVPSVSGIFELYFVDRARTLNFIDVYRAWYGGVRNALRELTDPLITRVPGLRDLAKQRSLVYRYSLSNSSADIADVLYFFKGARKPADSGAADQAPGISAGPVNHSGRYRYVYVNEDSPDKLITI